jgi:hypothetical protein
VSRKVKDKPKRKERPWVKCGSCDGYWCQRHKMHVAECACPPVEEWAWSPYKGTRGTGTGGGDDDVRVLRAVVSS